MDGFASPTVYARPEHRPQNGCDYGREHRGLPRRWNAGELRVWRSRRPGIIRGRVQAHPANEISWQTNSRAQTGAHPEKQGNPPARQGPRAHHSYSQPAPVPPCAEGKGRPDASTEESMIALLDYGSGNLRSVHKALLKVGAEVRIVQQPDGMEDARGVVLPGVGA